MFYVSKISLELWVSLEANNLKYYIQRLEVIHFKVIISVCQLMTLMCLFYL